MTRMTLAEPKMALAGVTAETSFARFKASMAAFSKERVPSRPFGRWDLVAMVEVRGGCEEEPEP